MTAGWRQDAAATDIGIEHSSLKRPAAAPGPRAQFRGNDRAEMGARCGPERESLQGSTPRSVMRGVSEAVRIENVLPQLLGRHAGGQSSRVSASPRRARAPAAKSRRKTTSSSATSTVSRSLAAPRNACASARASGSSGSYPDSVDR